MSCTICRSLCGVLVLLFVTITANGAEQPIYYYANTEVAKNISGSKTIHMTIDSVIVNTGVFKRKGVGYNGASPGPTLYWNEGERDCHPCQKQSVGSEFGALAWNDRADRHGWRARVQF